MLLFARILATVMFGVLPLLICLRWVYLNELGSWAWPTMQLEVLSSVVAPLSSSTRASGWLVDMALIVPALVVLWQVIQLLASFDGGRWASSATAQRLRVIGRVSLIWALTSVVHGALMSLVLTADNLPGQRTLAVYVGFGELNAILFGLTMFALATVMAEAQAAVQENRQFI